VIWKNAMIPKSPIEHPRRHHKIFCEAVRQVWLHRQLIVKCFTSADM
jgi:hypothetical protein